MWLHNANPHHGTALRNHIFCFLAKRLGHDYPIVETMPEKELTGVST